VVKQKKDKVLQTVSNYARLDKVQFEIVDQLCFFSKNLYNVGLYNVRQHYHAIQLALPEMDKLRPDIIADSCILRDTFLPYMRSKDHPFKEFSNSNLSKENENYTVSSIMVTIVKHLLHGLMPWRLMQLHGIRMGSPGALKEDCIKVLPGMFSMPI
jgi:hypothetical protein